MRILLAISIVSLFGVANAYAEIASPYEQLKSGVPLYEIQCEYQKILLESPRNNKPVCVKSDTADILVERGWHMIKIFDELPVAELSSDTTLLVATTGNHAESNLDAVSDPVPTKIYYPHLENPYLVFNGSRGGIDLSGIKLLPEGVYLPTTIENYERIMQKILDGIDDKLILPNSEGPRYDYALDITPGYPETGTKLNYTYYTEQGNIIRPLRTQIELIILEPDEIFRSDYLDKKMSEYYSLDQKDELAFAKNLIAGREKFLQNFVEKSELPRIVKTNHLQEKSHVYLENGQIEMRMEWGNVYMYFVYEEEPPFHSLSKNTMRQLMHQFAIDNAHVIDREWCVGLVLYDKDDIRDIGITTDLAGIPLWKAIVGTCGDPIYKHHTEYVHVRMEGITGEIGWFSGRTPVIDDWIDKINIPEHAKVR